MPSLGELRTLLDSQGKPICSSAGLPICVPCPTPPPAGGCCFDSEGAAACIALDPVSGPFDVTSGNPMVMPAAGFLPFGYFGAFMVGAGWTIAGQTTISGQTVCYVVRVIVGLSCLAGDPTKIEVRALAAGGDILEFPAGCFRSYTAPLWWWSASYDYLVLPDLQFETPLATVTWDCTTTLANIPFTFDIIFRGSFYGPEVFRATQTWNIQIKPYAPPCTFTAGVDPCELVDFPGGVNGTFREGIWVPGCEFACDCSGLPPDPIPPTPPPPDEPPPDHTKTDCCPGRTDFGVEVTASMLGVAAGFPFEPGCDRCLTGSFPMFWGPTVGPAGQPGWQGIFRIDNSCLTGDFVDYPFVIVRIYCLDGINWVSQAWFSGAPGSGLPDIDIETIIVTPPCSGTFPDNYFAIDLTANPGTNCASGCPCFGGAHLIAGP